MNRTQAPPGRADDVRFPTVRVWICKEPPAGLVEGIDFHRYDFRVGEVYDVGRSVAELLMKCGYAELERRQGDRRQRDRRERGDRRTGDSRNEY